ncbi:MAG: hypothetical protein R6V28_12705 [Nitriliruptoraceae bacterium]
MPRQPLPPDALECPFCRPAPDDPRLLAPEADRGAGRWFGMRNIYPPLTGPTGSAVLAVASDHDPTLTHLRPELATVWATQLDVQLQLARREPDRWALLTTAVGVSAGASQHHPHGQVLCCAVIPPVVLEQQRRWDRGTTLGQILVAAHTIAVLDDVHLVAPPVPLGPLDAWLVPAGRAGLEQLDVEVVASLVHRWLGSVHEQLAAPGASAAAPGRSASAPGRSAAAPGRSAAAPVDVKTLLHAPLPDGTGRWWAELQVTERHAPGAAAAPLVDVVDPPERHAARFRSADRPA